MNNIRRYAILLINALMLIWLLKLIYIDKVNDSVGVLILIAIVFLIFYNLYSLLLYNLFGKRPNKGVFYNGIFFILLVLPILVIWYYTS